MIDPSQAAFTLFSSEKNCAKMEAKKHKQKKTASIGFNRKSIIYIDYDYVLPM